MIPPGKNNQRFADYTPEASTRTILDQVDHRDRDAFGSENQQIKPHDPEVSCHEQISKKLQVSKESCILVPTSKHNTSEGRGIVGDRIEIKKPFEIIRPDYIEFEYNIISEYNQNTNLITFIFKRREHLTSSKVLENMKKAVGARFVEYLTREVKTELPGDSLDSLDVWNAFFNKEIREKSFFKTHWKFIEELRQLGAIVSEKEFIIYFINFLSEFNPHVFRKSSRMKTDNIREYIKFSTLICIKGKFLKQIPQSKLDLLSYFKIEEWNGNTIEISVRFDVRDQQELYNNLFAKCMNPERVYYYTSRCHSIDSFNFEHIEVPEEEEIRKVEITEEEKTETVGSENANPNRNIILDELISTNSRQIGLGRDDQVLQDSQLSPQQLLLKSDSRKDPEFSFDINEFFASENENQRRQDDDEEEEIFGFVDNVYNQY